MIMCAAYGERQSADRGDRAPVRVRTSWRRRRRIRCELPGFEVYDPGVAHTLLLAGKNGLGNLRVAQVNAPELFKVMADGVAAEVWTFFPDPWPKKKHQGVHRAAGACRTGAPCAG